MKLLMCPPTYYGIEYEINPWMRRSQQSNPREAGAQWDGLRRLLQEQLAVDIQLIESQPGLPDMVFTANGGLVWDDKFIVSNFRYEVRRREAAHFEEWFRNWGFNVTRLPPEMYFEGEGDLLKCGDTWFAGYHIRSDIIAHQNIAEIIEQEILSLELTNAGTTTLILASVRCARDRPYSILLRSIRMRVKFWKITFRDSSPCPTTRPQDLLATQSLPGTRL